MIDSKRFCDDFFSLNPDQSNVPPAGFLLSILTAKPTSGGVTASTEMLAAKRHAGVHTPVIVGKMIIANQQMAYAA